MSMTDQERERFPEYARYYDIAKEGDCQAIGEFIEWLQDSKYVVTERKMFTETRERIWNGEEYEAEIETDVVVVKSIKEWLCEFYGIDYRQAMREKDTYLNELLGELRQSKEE